MRQLRILPGRLGQTRAVNLPAKFLRMRARLPRYLRTPRCSDRPGAFSDVHWCQGVNRTGPGAGCPQQTHADRRQEPQRGGRACCPDVESRDSIVLKLRHTVSNKKRPIMPTKNPSERRASPSPCSWPPGAPAAYGAPSQATKDRCTQYAQRAVAQYQLMTSHPQCKVNDDLRWQSNIDNHYNACTAVPEFITEGEGGRAGQSPAGLWGAHGGDCGGVRQSPGIRPPVRAELSRQAAVRRCPRVRRLRQSPAQRQIVRSTPRARFRPPQRPSASVPA